MFHRSHGCRPARPPAKIFVRRRRPASSYGFRLKPQPGQNQGAADTGPPAVTGSRSQFFGTFFSGRAKPATATPNRISRGGPMPEKFPASSQYAPRSKGHGETTPLMPLVAAVRLRPGARIQMPLAQIFGPVSADRRPGARVRFEMRPFDADDGQRRLQAGRDSWSARTVQYEL